MKHTSSPFKGRGVQENPPNRFERLSHHTDPEAGAEGDDPDALPRLRTSLLRDPSRTILTHNDSPDVGFTVSVNPYRGCEHGCVYCLSGDTLVLMADGSLRALAKLKVGDEIYGTERHGWYRRYTKTRVLAHWKTWKPAFKITLADGTFLIASGDHRFLTEHGWKYVTGSGPGSEQRPHLTTANKLMGFGAAFAVPPVATRDYKAGSLCAVMCGDGRLGFYPYERAGRVTGHQYRFRFAMGDEESLVRSSNDLTEGGVRIANTDQVILGFRARGLNRLRHSYVLEERRRPLAVQYIRVKAGLLATLRLLQTGDSAILRKRSLAGQAVKSRADLRVLSVERLGIELPMYDITTETGDFIANGIVSHNCYARPTREWLGFSAGLDFETQILVKDQAPHLLRAALVSPTWQPQVIALSGVTDPYQPIERQLRLTRGCLEVLAEFRNPVAIVTKNALVTRDIDLLTQLARCNAAAVLISVTTLDPQLARRMEPRASAPAKRLDAIRILAHVGIPVGVNVAPIIPGLTDSETPAILRAAAEAGAQFAGHTIVRLPYGIGDLLTHWLNTHYPDRARKVLNKIRSIRNGKLNDARWRHRMRGEGVFADAIHALFALACRKAGLATHGPHLSTTAFRRPAEGKQLSLFPPPSSDFS